MLPQTVLVVDDHAFNRELVVDLLGAVGYTVLQAEDGEGLVERVKRERPALILLDLKLPGAHGFTLARQLKSDAETRAIPVVAMTADLLPAKRRWALEAGCDGYLRKPLDREELIQLVARFLGREE